VIFTSYNPDDSENEYTYFPDLMDQHIVILNLVETLRNKLQRREAFDISTLKELLVNHKNFEENHVYLVLDQEIDEGEKRFIIERKTEIIKERR